MGGKRNPRVFEYQHTVYSEQSKIQEIDLSLCTNTAFPTSTQIRLLSPFTPHISLSHSKKSDFGLKVSIITQKWCKQESQSGRARWSEMNELLKWEGLEAYYRSLLSSSKPQVSINTIRFHITVPPPKKHKHRKKHQVDFLFLKQKQCHPNLVRHSYIIIYILQFFVFVSKCVV